MTRKYALGRDVDLDKEVIRDKKGRRITEKRAAEIAEATLTKAGRGRLSLTGGSKHSPRVSFRTPPELGERAEGRAAREVKTVSQLVRKALEHLLAG